MKCDSFSRGVFFQMSEAVLVKKRKKEKKVLLQDKQGFSPDDHQMEQGVAMLKESRRCSLR